MIDGIRFAVMGPVAGEALNALYAESWPAHVTTDFAPLLAHSLTHVTARDGKRLVGWVYVAWDGWQHAFLLDPTVHPDYRHRGIGRELVRLATDSARSKGCAWLHVDYEGALTPFYEACGFLPTAAGLIRLS